jgi:hypothetical protein
MIVLPKRQLSIMKQPILKAILFFLYLLICTSSNAQDNSFPLNISSDNRYLEDQNQMPYFISGEAAWSLIAQLSKEDALLYLEDRKNKGFNVLMVNLIEHGFSNNPPFNYYGDSPFTGKTFVTPRENYFLHADYVIEEAEKLGITIMLFPIYLGYNCGSQGWCQEVKSATLEDMRSWGQFVGDRYKNFDNIIWSIGGDTNPQQVMDELRECANGILEKDNRHLFTAHNQPESFAVSAWPDESWLTVNNVYTYSSTLYKQCNTAFNYEPVMPFFMIESVYENEHGANTQQLRAQAYWSILSGGMGHIFGNCPIWHFGSNSGWCGTNNWESELSSDGSVSMFYMQKLFISRAWFWLVPDIEHNAVVSGYGSWGNDNYVTTALIANNNTLIAYLPSARQVTVDMSYISGVDARSWWYNPSNGEATEIGIFATAGQLDFTPPSNGDWVLVIDDASLELSAPGSDKYISPIRPVERVNVVQELSNYPNPLNSYTRFEYSVPKYSRVKMTIFNVLGQEIRVLIDAYEYAGNKTVDWDGTDNFGNSLSSGTYIYVLEIDKNRYNNKLIILK